MAITISTRSLRALSAALCVTALLCAGSDAGEEIRIDNAGLVPLHEATISAEEAGALVEIAAKEGAQVREGDLLARVNDAEARLLCEQAAIDVRIAEELANNDAQLRVAKKELELAMADLARNEKSNKQLANSVPEARLERLRLLVDRERFNVEKSQYDLKVAALSLESAKNRLMIAQERLARRQMRAPIAGTVVEVMHHKGEWLQPGEPLIRILRYDTLRCEAYVSAEKLVFAATSQPVVFHAVVPGHGPEEFPGRVTFVSPEANPVNGQVRVVAEIDNREGTLRAGYLGTLVIHRDPKSQAKDGDRLRANVALSRRLLRRNESRPPLRQVDQEGENE